MKTIAQLTFNNISTNTWWSVRKTLNLLTYDSCLYDSVNKDIKLKVQIQRTRIENNVYSELCERIENENIN